MEISEDLLTYAWTFNSKV